MIHPGINSSNFTKNNRYYHNDLKLTILHLPAGMSRFDDAIEIIKQMGYRPANLCEIIALSSAQFDIDENTRIAALGSIWNNSAPYIKLNNGKLVLDLIENNTRAFWTFAVV